MNNNNSNNKFCDSDSVTKTLTNFVRFCGKVFIHISKWYEYLDSWQRCNKTSLPDKMFFNSNPKMDDITYTDYKYPKRVNLRKENLGEYYDLSC